MTSGEPENWPGQATDPALSLPPSGDFDDGLLRRWSYALLVPAPRPAVFEEWTACIAVTEIDSQDVAYLSPELIGEVFLTRTHVVVKSHTATLLIPTRTFATPTEAVAVAHHIADLSKGPYYFDAQD